MPHTLALLEATYNALTKRMGTTEALDMTCSVRDEIYASVQRRDSNIVAREIASCRSCDGVEYLNKVAVYNTQDPLAVVVLERPQIGAQASHLVTSALSDAGFDKSNFALTYLNRCVAVQGQSLSAIHRENCLGFLYDELFTMNPKIVIACGKVVAQALIGPLVNLSSARGDVFWAHNSAVMVTYSPLYVTSKNSPDSAKEIFYADIKAAAQLTNIGKTNDD